MSAHRSAPRTRPRTSPGFRSLLTGWSIGLLAAVLGLVSFTAVHAAELTAASTGTETSAPPAKPAEEPTADLPATNSWLTAALATTSVTGAGTDRRFGPDTALPVAIDDSTGNLFRATAIRTEPAAGQILPKRVTAHLPDSRAPPSAQVRDRSAPGVWA